MSEVIQEGPLKIRDVHDLWRRITGASLPVSIDLNGLSGYDGAGLQMIVHLMSLCRNHPESYRLRGVPEELEHMNIKFTREVKQL